MLKINCVRNVRFIGDCNDIVTQLTCPFSGCRCREYFYFRKTLYKICDSGADACVLVVPALDFVRRFDYYTARLTALDNPILVLTRCRVLRRFGLRINARHLSYALSVPVIASSRPLNKLLEALHITCNLINADLHCIFNFCIYANIRH